MWPESSDCWTFLAPGYLSKYFQFKKHKIYDYDTKNKDKLVINRVK
mgnify:CR=1 FL=1